MSRQMARQYKTGNWTNPEPGQNSNGHSASLGTFENQDSDTKCDNPSFLAPKLQMLHFKYELSTKTEIHKLSDTLVFLASILAVLQPISLSHRFSLLGPDFSAAPNSFPLLCLTSLSINPAKMQSKKKKKKVAHITQVPESLDYSINRGILDFLVMDSLPASQPAFWQLIISLNIFRWLFSFIFQ